MSSTRAALEAALAANPDDVAAHAAYADLLIEEDDPRGEFIQLQLAIEDRNQPADRLRAMEQRAFEIREQHEREWLGPLAQHVFPNRRVRSVHDMVSERNVEVAWRRGWIDAVRVRQVSDRLVAEIAECSLTRILGKLSIRHNVEHRLNADDPGNRNDREITLQPLIDAGRFRLLRSFVLGAADDGHTLAGGFESDEYFSAFGSCLEEYRVAVDHVHATELFTGDFPALGAVEITSNNSPLPLEGLALNPNLPNIRSLFIDRTDLPGPDWAIDEDREPYSLEAFDCFFRTQHLTKLDTLGFRLPDFGDRGVELLIESGFINRLKVLDLCRCSITDEGAELLARCPHVPRLDHLHLDNNLLSPIGIEALAAVGVTVSERQFYAGGGDAQGYDYP